MVSEFKFFEGYNTWRQPPLNRPIEPTDMEFYNIEGAVFVDVTETRYDEETYLPYKRMLYRHIEHGDTFEGHERMEWDHPMWNFPDVM